MQAHRYMMLCSSTLYSVVLVTYDHNMCVCVCIYIYICIHVFVVMYMYRCTADALSAVNAHMLSQHSLAPSQPSPSGYLLTSGSMIYITVPVVKPTSLHHLNLSAESSLYL